MRVYLFRHDVLREACGILQQRRVLFLELSDFLVHSRQAPDRMSKAEAYDDLG